jgi:peptidoglycan/LPS O-acetylase OafA/YrhL
MSILNLTWSRAQPWDVAGIGASLLCVLHCLATPLLVVFVPTLEIIERPTHATLAIAILAFGMLAFWPGYRRHRRWRVVAAAFVGFGLVSLGVVAPDGLMSEPTEQAVTVIGGGTLVFAHLCNAFFCSRCPVCSGQDCLGA